MATFLLPKAVLQAGTILNQAALRSGAVGGPLALHPATAIGLTIAGGLLDQFVIFPRLFAQEATEGPRLSGIQINTELEGSPQNRVFGQEARVPCTLVWKSELREVKDEDNAGAKGGTGSAFIAYRSFVHLGYQICRGPIEEVLKLWADGELIYDAAPDVNESSTQITASTDSSQVFGQPEGTNRLILTSNEAAGGPDLSELKSGKLAVVSGFPNVDPIGGTNTFTTFTGAGLFFTATASGTLNVDDTIEVYGTDVVWHLTSSFSVSVGSNLIPDSSLRPTVLELAGEVNFDALTGVPVTFRRSVGSNNGTWEVWRSYSDEAAATSSVELISQHVAAYPFVATVSGDSVTVFQSQSQFRETNAADIRFQLGTDDQQADRLLTELESATVGGADNVYACRGRAMVWIEDFEVTDFGRPPFVEALVRKSTSADLGDVVEEVVSDYDVTDANLDVSHLRGKYTVRGFSIRGPQLGKTALQPLMIARHLLAREEGAKIVFEDRATLDTGVTLDANDEDLGVNVYKDDSAPRPVLREDVDDRRLPDSIVLRYVDPDDDHQERTKRKGRNDPGSLEQEQVSVAPYVMTGDEAQQLVNSLFAISRAARTTFSGTVAQKHLGDVYDGAKVTLANCLGRDWTVIVREATVGANTSLNFTARREENQVFSQTVTSEPAQATAGGSGVNLPAATVLWHSMDLPALTDEESEQTGVYFTAANADGRASRGFFVYMEDGERFTRVATLNESGVTGRATTSPSSTGISHLYVDRATTLRVQLDRPEDRLESVPESSMIKGRNRFLWGDEIIGAAACTYVSDGVYDLSILLRGIKDTDDEMNNHAVGDRIVRLDGPGIAFVPLDIAAMESSRRFKVIGAGGSLDDASPRLVTLDGRSVKPFRVVNFESERQSNNNVVFTWDRQTRYNTQMFDTGEPLGEDDERYLLEIIDNNVVVRTFNTTTASQTYTAAQQSSDANIGAFDARVRQLSKRMHYGRPRTISVAGQI